MPNCFTNLDELPIYIWWKLQENGDVKLLLKKQTKARPIAMMLLHKIWGDLINSYVEMFGFSEQFKKILRHKRELHSHYVKYIVNGDRTEQVFINILEQEISEMEASMKGKNNNMELKAHLDKHFGFQIDIKKTSVVEYMNYISVMETQMAT